jgi:antitoxin component of MazEF toxin-antitoxin module
MITKIVKIGNSKGIRIPKSFIVAADLGDTINLELEKGRLVITRPPIEVNDEALLSEAALSDWLLPEEEKAWKHLQ